MSISPFHSRNRNLFNTRGERLFPAENLTGFISLDILGEGTRTPHSLLFGDGYWRDGYTAAEIDALPISPTRLLQGGATDGQVLAWDNGAGEWAPITISGGAISGSANEVAVCDGSGGASGDANLTWDGTNHTLSISGAANQYMFAATTSGGMYAFSAADVGGQSACGMGDSGENCSFYINNSLSIANINAATGSVTIGDSTGNGAGTQFIVDDGLQQTRSNVKHEASGDFFFMLDSIGPVLIDRNDGVTQYRIFYDSGAGGLQVEAA